MATREDIERLQLQKLNRLVDRLRDSPNQFQQTRLSGITEFGSLEDYYSRVPFTTKSELLADRTATPPFGTNLTFPVEKYTRYCQTSGSTGTPAPWLDTDESWTAMLDNWKRVYNAAGLAAPGERVFFAFSFGPFLGFWTAFEAAVAMGLLAIPGGGMSSDARLETINRLHVETLCCTPTYALRLGEIHHRQSKAKCPVKRIIVAGEPGGSIDATRIRISELWDDARVFDHHGMTEVGPVTYETIQSPLELQVMEDTFLAEVVDPESGNKVAPGKEGELVLTTLDRAACPLLRYRTGDLVSSEYRPEMVLPGGILGRLDDMILVRGVNIYPAAVESVVREIPDIEEYRVEITEIDSMRELTVFIESDNSESAERLADKLRSRLQLRVPVKLAAKGNLPRHEFKARRWVRI